VATNLAEITRGTLVESVHQGNVAVVDADGTLIAFGGDPNARAFFRSSAKPFQALPLMVNGAADAFGFSTEEIALSTASHDSTDRHQTIAASMLEKANLSEADLMCGFSPPFDEEEKARVTLGLEEATAIKCECSGEHAGMLAACRHKGWPTADYVSPDHPLQQEILAFVAAGCGLSPSDLELATDGCSIPTFGAPIRAFAQAYAVIADPEGARWDAEDTHRTALVRLREAMLLHPELISGDDADDTNIMRITEGRVVAKLGAEGMLCLAIPGHRLGVAIVDAGGSRRSLGPAAVAVLEELGLEDDSTLQILRKRLCPPIESFAGEAIGETRPALHLERP
jgi:L-asparaginase II